MVRTNKVTNSCKKILGRGVVGIVAASFSTTLTLLGGGGIIR